MTGDCPTCKHPWGQHGESGCLGFTSDCASECTAKPPLEDGFNSVAEEFRDRAIDARKGLQKDYSWMSPGLRPPRIKDAIEEQSLQIQSVLYEIGAAILDALEAKR